MLLNLLNKIPDHRRAQGKQFWLWHIIYFSILSILSGSTSYREISTFIDVHIDVLRERFGLKWKKTPKYWCIRKILIWINPEDLESIFREYSQFLVSLENTKWVDHLAIDGKVLRWSYDHINDEKSIQVLSWFLNSKLILAHDFINEKTNEIPVAQNLFKELWIKWVVITLDALHTQKKLLNQ